MSTLQFIPDGQSATPSALEQAVNDTVPRVQVDDDGSVLAGTLEGLIERLISDAAGMSRISQLVSTDPFVNLVP
jgi:hypothetical protein